MRKGNGLYVVGGGGLQTQSVKLYRAAGWTVRLVPFFFSVFRPATFLRKIEYLRRKRLLRAAADVAAFTGLGSLVLPSVQATQAVMTGGMPRRVSYEKVDRFEGWADDIWMEHRDKYSFTQSHSSSYLNLIYNHTDGRVVRLRVLRGDGQTIGWVLVITGGQPFEAFFGDMRVGLVLDGFCAPENARSLVAAATHYLKAMQVDVAISNQWHPAWQRACLGAGFLRGPSNFPLAFSPGLVGSLGSLEGTLAAAHLNRGHGDGIALGPRRALPPGVKRNPKETGMAGQ
jgi:hypothetical protein